MEQSKTISRILLHICCGPCSLSVIDALQKEFQADVSVTGFFYNPNLFPYGEWIRRRKSTESACRVKKFRC